MSEHSDARLPLSILVPVKNEARTRPAALSAFRSKEHEMKQRRRNSTVAAS
jgi:hypothetical protein